MITFVAEMTRTVPLRTTEQRLLTFFMQNPDRVISKEMLLEKVWGYASTILKTNTVETHISSLRKKLKIFGNGTVRTVMKRGYIWEPLCK